MQLKYLPKWQRDIFDANYFASFDKRDSMDYTISADIKRACTRVDGLNEVFVLSIIDRYRRRLKECLKTGDPSGMAEYFDTIISVVNVWRKADELEAFELSHRCKHLSDLTVSIPEFAQYSIMVYEMVKDEIPNSLAKIMSELNEKNKASLCN
jgi:hypothetical protein